LAEGGGKRGRLSGDPEGCLQQKPTEGGVLQNVGGAQTSLKEKKREKNFKAKKNA